MSLLHGESKQTKQTDKTGFCQFGDGSIAKKKRIGKVWDEQMHEGNTRHERWVDANC